MRAYLWEVEIAVRVIDPRDAVPPSPHLDHSRGEEQLNAAPRERFARLQAWQGMAGAKWNENEVSVHLVWLPCVTSLHPDDSIGENRLHAARPRQRVTGVRDPPAGDGSGE